MNWIKVSERLPDLYETVLIYPSNNEDEFFEIGWRTEPEYSENGIVFSCNNGHTFHHDITHWALPPKPPKD